MSTTRRIARLRAIAATENRPASQIVAVALRTMLNLSPGARRALYAIDSTAEAAERATSPANWSDAPS